MWPVPQGTALRHAPLGSSLGHQKFLFMGRSLQSSNVQAFLQIMKIVLNLWSTNKYFQNVNFLPLFWKVCCRIQPCSNVYKSQHRAGGRVRGQLAHPDSQDRNTLDDVLLQTPCHFLKKTTVSSFFHCLHCFTEDVYSVLYSSIHAISDEEHHLKTLRLLFFPILSFR